MRGGNAKEMARRNVMTKNKLLIAAAVAALTAGSGLALAQSSDQNKAPAEKSAPSGAMKSAPEKKGAENKGAEQNKGSAQKAEDRSKPSQGTTGQAPAQNQNKMQNRSTTGQGTPSQPSTGQTQQQPSTGQTPTQRGTSPSGQTTTSPSGQSGGAVTGQSGSSTTNVNVNLNPEQRTRIREVIVKDRSAPRVTRVDFQLSVGTVVPRGKVKFKPLPREIVVIQPAWRGYEYFLVGDEIVVVDPRTLRIVAIIPA